MREQGCIELDLMLDDPAAMNGGAAALTPRPCRLRLAGDYIREVAADGRETVWDFARRRRLAIDPGARAYLVHSLYAGVASRHHELPNRAHIRGVLAAGGADTAMFSRVVSEHQLSLLEKESASTVMGMDTVSRDHKGSWWKSLLRGPQRPDPEAIRASSDGRTQRYASATGQELMSWSTDGVEVEPATAHRFVLYLRHCYNGHPLLLRQLASSGRIPRQLVLDNLQPPEDPGSRVVLRLNAVRPIEDDIDRDLSEYRRLLSFEPEDPVVRLLEPALLGEVPSEEEVVAARVQEALRSEQAGRALESVLTLFELMLQTGFVPPGFGASVAANPDPDVRRLQSAMGAPPRSKEEMRARIDTLVGLRAAAGRRAHVLGTFEAALRSNLGEGEAQRALLLDAVRANPFLALAHKDLGDHFVRCFDTDLGWTFYEAARKSAPSHGALVEIGRHEEMLAAQHPEFFG